MKKIIAIISIICIIAIAGAVLILTGVINIGGSKQESSQNSESTPIAWISYMDSYVLVDKDHVITGAAQEQPEGIMHISGVNITTMVKGQTVKVDDEDALDYALLVTEKLAASGISDVGEVFIASDHSATLYLNNVKILLGTSDYLTEKLESLRKFYEDLKDLNGTLDMQEYDKNNMGYTFQKNEQ